MTAVSREYDRLVRAVKERHQKLFPAHDVSADDLVVWCQTCQKGIDSETDGPRLEIMRTPLQALTEITERIKARRAVYQGEVRRLGDAGLRTRAVDNAMQAASMKEALDIIQAVEQGH